MLNPWTLLAILAAVLLVCCLFAAWLLPVAADAVHAEAPEVEDIPQTRWQPCRLNATPHWCFQPPPMVLAGSDLIDAQVPAGTGERIAREIEDFLRSIA